jgi:ADP-L-glycero-D-manno-heptose 6-epimerase
MIIVTGAAGFIGSCVVQRLNDKGITDLILVDDFSQIRKSGNYNHKKYSQKIERSRFLDWFEKNKTSVKYVIHIGAKTDTTLFDVSVFDELNVGYTKTIWSICTQAQIPLIYASSAATYGLGEFGYEVF